MNNIKSSILVIIVAMVLVMTPVVSAIAQTTNTDSNNTTTTTTDNSQDNDQDNDTINKEKVVVTCETHNKIEDSANAETKIDGDVETKLDGDTENGNEIKDNDPTVTGTQTNGDQTATQTVTQETTVEQLPSVVADFEQRGCDITVNYKTETVAGPTAANPTPIVVTNTVEKLVTVNVPATTQVVRTVTVPSTPPNTGGSR